MLVYLQGDTQYMGFIKKQTEKDTAKLFNVET